MKQYNDLDYAANRLMGTIVSYMGDPVYVHHPDGDYFYVEFLGTRKKKNVPAMELDINPIPLGYVNTDHGAVYVGRKPIRKDWRQGYRENNSFSFGNPIRDIQFQYLHDTVKGIYPPFTGCMKRAKNKHEKVAFHREWCVDQHNHLIYKDEHVGDWKDERFILKENKMYLEGKLVEALHENHLRNH